MGQRGCCWTDKNLWPFELNHLPPTQFRDGLPRPTLPTHPTGLVVARTFVARRAPLWPATPTPAWTSHWWAPGRPSEPVIVTQGPRVAWSPSQPQELSLGPPWPGKPRKVLCPAQVCTHMHMDMPPAPEFAHKAIRSWQHELAVDGPAGVPVRPRDEPMSSEWVCPPLSW